MHGLRRGIIALVSFALVAAMAVVITVGLSTFTASEALAGTTTNSQYTLTKTASTTSLPVGGGQVTYTYTIKNNLTTSSSTYYQGRLYLDGYYSPYGAGLYDDTCANIRPVSGISRDYLGDEYIAAGATATWTCTTTVTSTTTNTVYANLIDYWWNYYRQSDQSTTETVNVAVPALTCSTPIAGSDPTSTSSGKLYQINPTTGAQTLIVDLATLPSAGGGAYDGTSAIARGTTNPNLIYYVPRDQGDTAYNNGLWVYDLSTKTATRVSSSTTGGTVTNRMAVSPNGTLYSWANNGTLYRLSGSSWVTVGNITSVTGTNVPSAAQSPASLASGDIVFDGLGNLWMIGSNQSSNYLYTISAAELAGDTSLTATYVGDMGSGTFNGLSFDTSGNLYASARPTSTTSAFYRVNKENGSTTLLHNLSGTGLIGDLASCALPKPELRITKTAGSDRVVAGGLVTYTVTIENIGSLSATGVTFQDTNITGGTYQSSTLNGATVGTTGVNYWATARAVNSPGELAGQIAPGDKATITITVRSTAPAGSTVCNQGTASWVGGPTSGQLTDNPSTSTSPDPTCVSVVQPGIAVDKTANASSVNVSGPVTYSYRVTNTGNEPLKTVSLSDDKCANPTLQAPDIAAGTGDMNGNGQLEQNEAWVYTCTQTISTQTTNTATARGTGIYSSSTVSATDTWTVTITRPSLNVTKTAGALSGPDANGNYAATYTISVTNNGDGAGTYGPITDTPSFDPNVTVTGASWTGQSSGTATGAGPFSIGGAGTTIAAGATHTYNLTVTFRYTGTTQATQCTGGAGSGLYNSVTMAGDTVATDNAACVNPPALPTPSMTLTKTAGTPTDVNGNGVTDAGDTIVYTFAVTNTGNVNLYNVVVNDSKLGLAGYACAAGPVAPGATVTCTAPAPYTITAADQTARQVANTATARAEKPGGSTATTTDDVISNPSSTATPVASAPSLNVSKQVASVPTTINSATGTFQVTYRVNVTNSGDTPTTYGPLVDTAAFAPNLQVVSVSWSGQSSGTATGAGPYTLAPAGTAIAGNTTQTYLVTFVVRYTNTEPAAACAGAGTGLYNSVAIPNENGSASDNNACADPPAPPAPAIDLTKTAGTIIDVDGNGAASAGDTIGYTFTVTNTGNLNLDPVTVTDPMLAAQGITITCPAGPLAPGATVSCTASAPYQLTQADINAGAVNNTATATGTPPGGYPPPTYTSSTTTPIPSAPAILLEKNVTALTDVNGNGRTDLGDQVTYSFTVTNTGNVTLTGVTVTDPKLAGLTITCPATTLAPLASTTCTASGPYTIGSADVTAGNVTNTATATGTTPTGGTVSDNDIEVVPVVNPSLSLTKSVQTINDLNGNGRTDAGDTISYRFIVTNTGNTTLTGVTVTDPKVGGATCPTTTLSPGASVTCTSSQLYTVTVADANAGAITNTATASGNPPTGTPVTGSSTATTPTSNPSITIDKTHAAPTDVNGNGRTDAGDTVVYSFAVTNTGNTALRSIVLTDSKLTSAGASISCPSTSLAVGASMTCTSTAYTITAADATAGAVDNYAAVTAQPPTGTAVTGSDTDQVLIQRASITMDKSHATPTDVNGDGRVSAGDTISYSFSVTNTGNVDLAAISVDDPMLAAAGVTITCPTEPLAPGATATCTASPYTITDTNADAGVVNNSATASAQPPTGSPVTASDTDTQAVDNPSLELTKTVDRAVDVNGDGRIGVGDQIWYDFVVRNTGNVTLSQGVLTDTMAPQTTCNSYALAPGATTDCWSTAPYIVTQADVDAGAVINTATATGTPPRGAPVSDTDTATQPVQSASIVLDKANQTPVDVNGNGRVDAGDTVVFTFTVTNTGTTTVTDVTITDPRLASAGVSIACPTAPLAPGTSTTCTSSPKTISEATAEAGVLNNTASASAQPVNADGSNAGNPVSATDTNSFPTLYAAIDLVKQVASTTDTNGNGRVDAGDLINYRFVVTNTGNAPLTGVTITDTKVGAVSCPSTSLAVDASMTCTVSYVVTDTEATAGSVENTATASGQPTGPDGSPAGAPVTDTDSAVQPTSTASIAIDKRVVSITDTNSNGRTGMGDTVTFDFVVTNTGTTTLNNVQVTDPMLTGIGCPSSTLASGASMTCTADPTTITREEAIAGKMINTATAAGQPADGSAPVTAQDTETVDTVMAEITLEKSGVVTDVDGDGRIDEGDRITYKFVVRNTGTLTLTDVTLTDDRLTNVTCPSTPLPGGEKMDCTADVYTITAADVTDGDVVNNASVTGQPVYPGGADAGTPVTATDTVTQSTQDARIQVEKSAVATDTSNPTGTDPNGRIGVNDRIVYTFVITNTGAVSLTGVTLSDNMLPAGSLSCPADLATRTLAPGESVSCTATYTITVADTADNVVQNVATVTGTPPTGTPVTDTDDANVPAYYGNIALDKSHATPTDVNGNGRTDAGDTITYGFLVTNIGNATLTSISVSDPLLGAISCPSTSLAGGASMTCTAAPYTVTAADASRQQIVNTATAQGQPVDEQSRPIGNPVNAADTDTVPTQAASIALDKRIASTTDANNNGRVDEGDSITYEFTVTNSGVLTIDGIALTDVVNTALPTDDQSTTAVVCPQTSLAGGASMTCTVSHTVTTADAQTDPARVDNTATVTGQPVNADGTPAGNEVDATDTASQPIEDPAITLDKTGVCNDDNANGLCDVGDTITYTFAVQNTGNVSLADVHINDPQLAARGAVAACTATTLAVGDSMSCTATVPVTAGDVDAGAVLNSATVYGTPPNGTAVSSPSSATVPTDRPQISLEKTNVPPYEDVNNNSRLDTGDVVTYDFAVTNTGNMPLANVEVVDPMIVDAGGTVTCPQSTLAVGETINCSAQYTITDADQLAGRVENTATVHSNPVLPGNEVLTGVAVTDVDSDSGLVANAVVDLTKRVARVDDTNGDGRTGAGDVIHYELMVANPGNLELTNIEITDPLAGAVSCPATSLLPGGSMVCTASHTITDAEGAAGQVPNTAEVTAIPVLPGGTATGQVTDESSAIQPTEAATMTLAKTNGDGVIDTNANGIQDAGDTITYTFTVANTGTMDLRNISITDAGLGLSQYACDAGPVVPGASISCEYTYTLKVGDLNAQQVYNQATANAVPEIGTPITATDDVTTPVQGTPALELHKTASPIVDVDGNGQDEGDTISYTFEIVNTGSVSLTDVVIDDPKLGLVDFVCTAGPIAPGQTVTCAYPPQYVLTQDDIDAGQVLNTATAVADSPEGPTPPSEDDTTTLVAPVTDLQLVKSAALADTDGDGLADEDETIQYSFTVTNNGNVTLTNVTISDPDLGPDAFVCVTELAPGASATCDAPAPYSLTVADLDAGWATNTATATGNPPGGEPITSQPSSTETPVDQNPAIALDKVAGAVTDVDGNGHDAGDTVSYDFTITNTGNVTLTGVTLDDARLGLAGHECGVTTVAPGESTTCTPPAYVLTQADIDAGTVHNDASTRGTAPGGVTVTAADFDDVTLAQAPAISLVKNASDIVDTNPDGIDGPGDTINYTFTVTNTGNVTLASVQVTDPLVGAVTCPSRDLLPGQSFLCTAAVYALTQADVDAGRVYNEATATGTPPAGTPPTATDDNEVPIEPAPAIDLQKTAGTVTDTDVPANGTSDAGDTIVFTFTVTNTGNVTLNDVVVSDPLLAGANVAIDCPVTTLAAGETMTCTSEPYPITQDEVDAGAVTNDATATGTPTRGTPPTDGATSTTPLTAQPAIDLVKNAALADADADGLADVGETISYSFIVTNTGSVTLTGVTVTDQMLAPLNIAIDCPATSLIPGQSMTCTASTYTVAQADIDALSPLLSNVATATGTAPDGQQPTDDGNADIPKDQGSGVTIDKSASLNDIDGDELADVGETIAYTFTVTNTGTVTLTNINVNDPMLAAAGSAISIDPTFDGTLEPGTTVTFTSLYAVTQADVDAGAVSNSATATGSNPGGGSTTSPPDTTDTPTGGTPGLLLDKQVTWTDMDDSGEVNLDDYLDYTFVITNTGTVTMSNIRVDDQMLITTDVPITLAETKTTAGGAVLPYDGTLAPGETVVATAAGYDIWQTDMDRGVVHNVAVAEGSTPNGTAAQSNTDETTTPIPQHPALEIVKSVTDDTPGGNGDGIAQLGERLSYLYSVTNTGDVTLYYVRPSDPKLEALGYTYVAVEGGGDSLAVGQTRVFRAVILDPVTNEPTIDSGYLVTQTDVDAGSVDNIATATGDAPQGDVSNPDDNIVSKPSEASIPTGQAPELSVDKTVDDASGDGKAQVGEELTYTFVVTNDGTVTLNDIAINDAMLAGADVAISCPAGPLAPGESVTCTSAPYTVTQADIDAGQVTNTATAQGTSPGATTPTESTPTEASIPTDQQLALTLVKQAQLSDSDGDGLADAGETISYTFTVMNTGNTTLTRLVVDDPKLTAAGVAISCPAEPLAPEGSATCASAPYTVTQADIDAGMVANAATARGEKPGGNPDDPADDVPSNPSDTTTPVDTTPGMTLVKSSELSDTNGDQLAGVGETISYSFVVTNTGAVTLSNVTVADQMLAAAGVTVSCPVETLVPGESVTCTSAPYTVTQGDVDNGVVANIATARADKPGGNPDSPDDDVPSNPDDDYVPTQNAPALALVKIVSDANGDGFIQVGEKLTYTFTLTNTGAVTLDGLSVTDGLLASAGVAITCPAGPLTPGESMTCTSGEYTVTQANVDSGLLENTATGTGTTPDGTTVPSNDDTESIPAVNDTSLSMLKTAELTDADGDGLAGAGETITYSFALTNTGSVSLSDLSVTDEMLAAAGVGVSCPAGPLAPGESATCTAAPYTVTQADVDAGKVNNTATAQGSTPTGTTTESNPDSTTTPTSSDSELTLSKTSALDDENGDGLASRGETITYSFVVTNVGDVTVDDVAIDDDMLASVGITCPATTLAPGESVTCTSAPYTVTQADVDSGSVDNVATATGTVPPADPTDPTQPPAPITSNPDEDHVPTSQAASLSLLKEVKDQRVVNIGDELVYTFTVTNTGVRTVSGISVADPMLGGAGVGITCPDTSLAPGESVTCTSAPYTVTAADVYSGKVHNDAVASGETSTGTPVESNHDTVDVPTTIATTMSLRKSAVDESGDGIAALDEKVTFTFEITNTGVRQITDITIDDPWASENDLSISCPATALDPGQSMTCESSAYTVTQADVDAGAISNTATATGEGPTDVPVVTPPSQTTTPTPYGPALVMDKAVKDASGNGIAEDGEKLTFTFVITNTGTTTVENVAVSDPMLTEAGIKISFPSDFDRSLAPGESVTATATYTVDDDDVSAGQVTNIAHATGDAPKGPITSNDDQATIPVQQPDQPAPVVPPVTPGTPTQPPVGPGAPPKPGAPATAKPKIAYTGVDVAPMAGLAALLLAAGAAAAYAGRRRRSS